MNLNRLSTQLLYTTMPLWIEYEDSRPAGSGTAFVYIVPLDKPTTDGSGIPFLITNKHVVYGSKRIVFEVNLLENELPAHGKAVKVELPGILPLPSEDDDLAAI